MSLATTRVDNHEDINKRSVGEAMESARSGVMTYIQSSADTIEIHLLYRNNLGFALRDSSTSHRRLEDAADSARIHPPIADLFGCTYQKYLPGLQTKVR